MCTGVGQNPGLMVPYLGVARVCFQKFLLSLQHKVRARALGIVLARRRGRRGRSRRGRWGRARWVALAQLAAAALDRLRRSHTSSQAPRTFCLDVATQLIAGKTSIACSHDCAIQKGSLGCGSQATAEEHCLMIVVMRLSGPTESPAIAIMDI